jgi:hypothetical protein
MCTLWQATIKRRGDPPPEQAAEKRTMTDRRPTISYTDTGVTTEHLQQYLTWQEIQKLISVLFKLWKHGIELQVKEQ